MGFPNRKVGPPPLSRFVVLTLYYVCPNSSCHLLEISGLRFWVSRPWELPWHSAFRPAGVFGGKVQKLPSVCRGRSRGRAAPSSLRPEPPGNTWGRSSKVGRQKRWWLLPWERRRWHYRREQLGSRVPAAGQGGSGPELRLAPPGLCRRRCPAGCQQPSGNDCGWRRGGAPWRLEPRR